MKLRKTAVKMNLTSTISTVQPSSVQFEVRSVVVRLLMILSLLMQMLLTLTSPAYASDDVSSAAYTGDPVVINEIHYDPAPGDPSAEFIELHNPGDRAINLSGWALAGGVAYDFPAGTLLPARGYLIVARDQAVVERVFGVRAIGQFSGRLSNDGDSIILRNESAQEVDSVEYGVGFPWPVVGYQAERSINLLHWSADNSLGGAWRAASPTPGRANAGAVDNLPPIVHSVSHLPQAPTVRDSVSINARITDRDGVSRVTLWLQVVPPGAYIRITDPAYASQWSAYEMQQVGDDRYTFTLPSSIVRHRYLIRYRVEASDRAGRSVVTPLPDDPQPNFALFVNDRPISWLGAVNPHEGTPRTIHRFEQMRALPIYHLIANPTDVADAQFLPPSTRESGYMGTEYLWRGTFVYDGVVYDHIGFRARGQAYRYATGKNKWKFNFLPGHRLKAKDNFGNPYPVEWDKLNLSGGMQHANRGYRGDHGVFEALALRIFAMAGVPAPATHFVHLRVVDQTYEITTNQYEGDFWGLYLAVEEIDRRFLRARDLPDGNLYKMKDWSGGLENQGAGQPGDGSDLAAFMGAYAAPQGESWWRANFDLENYYRFRAALEAVRHYDVDEGKNYYYFRNPEDGRWSIWPWDTDLTWADRFFGRGAEPFRDRVLPIAAFAKEYQNHLRELRDLLFNSEQIELLVNEHAALIDTPSDGPSMVDADRAMWDYNPILRSRYVIDYRARWGEFYRYSPTGDFPGMMAYMKSWANSRMAWIDQTLLTDQGAPSTPSVAYSGPAGYPADSLTFTASAFVDPQGDAFAGIQWRAAQVVWPGLPGYAANVPNRYEIDNAWTSPVLTQAAPFTAPPGVCAPGLACRVRVRMLDSTGRWSHWSAPLQFIAGEPAAPPTNALKITEIMYNPPDRGNTPSKELEFIELKNTGATMLDLSNVQVRDGIDYRFPIGVKLAPGAFILLAENPTRFAARYGIEAHGRYSGQLSNSGETIEVVDAFGRVITRVAYSDRGGWPIEPDGGGWSLVVVEPGASADPNLPTSWRASTVIGGSPGADDPAPIVLNEFIFDPTSKELRAVELYNPAPHPVDLSGWVVSDRQSTMPVFGARIGDAPQIPAGVTIAAGGYQVVTLTQLNRPLQFGAGPGTVMIGSVMRGNLSSGYAQSVTLYAPAYGDSIGRVALQNGGGAYAPQNSTAGAPNSAPLPAPVTMTKVRLLTDNVGPVQWIELTNRSDVAIPLYAPGAPAETWMIDGVSFQFPPATTLPPRGRLLAAVGTPSTVCVSGAAPAGWQVTGPLPQSLPAGGGTLRLLAPMLDATTGKSTRLLVDEIHFNSVERLQTTPGATYWQRMTDDSFGADAANWRAANEPLLGGDGVDDGLIGLCSFHARRVDAGAIQLEWAARAVQAEQQFVLWRSITFDRSAAQRVNGEIQNAAQGEPAAFRLIDFEAPEEGRPYYWLQVVGGGIETDVAVVGLSSQGSALYLPVIAR